MRRTGGGRRRRWWRGWFGVSLVELNVILDGDSDDEVSGRGVGEVTELLRDRHRFVTMSEWEDLGLCFGSEGACC